MDVTKSDEGPMDYGKLYKDVNQISMKWEKLEFSRDVVVHRMYVRLEDLDVTGLTGYDKAKRLYVFADVVELPPVSKKIRLAGSDKVVIVCRLLYAPATTDKYVSFPSLKYHMEHANNTTTTTSGVYIQADTQTHSTSTTKSDTSEFRLECGSTTSQIWTPWYKPPARITCSVQGATGFNLTTLGSIGNFWILDMGNQAFPNSPLDVISDPNILLGMQATVLIAELVQAANNSAELFVAITKHVKWLSDILVQVTNMQGATRNAELLALLFRVQAFLKMRPRSLVVPRLQYEQYEKLIDSMVKVAEDYDTDFKQLKLFIEQNRILGSYLLQQNKAFAEKEIAMDSHHSKILNFTRDELTSTIERMEKMSKQMDEQNKAMEQAKKDMDKGLVIYQNKQVANAVFEVLGAIASIALAFATGGATAPGAVAAAAKAVTTAGKLAEGLKKVVEILENLQKVMEVVTIIKNLVDALNGIGQLVNAPQMPELPSDADWEIFVNEVEAVAETMPTEVSEVPTWKAKCKNVAAMGKEMSTIAAYIADLQYRIKVEESLQDIAKQQADRLLSIQAADLTNYMEMATQIDMRTTRLLLELIKVLYIQNPALMYEYLQAPALLKTWPVDMRTIYDLLKGQAIDAVKGLTNLGPSIDLSFKHTVENIPVSILLKGEDWHFDITMNDIPQTWSRVRIRYLEAHFVDDNNDHKPKTGTDRVYILLQTSRSFRDRKREEVMNYEASVGMQYAFAYRLGTGETTLPNQPSGTDQSKFMRMTPCTHWALRLSASAEENQGLAFPTATSPDSTAKISIVFYVTAIRGIDLRDA